MFSTKVAREHVDRTLEGRRVSVDDYGTNPCSEIILKHREFCNLSEVVIRPDDDEQVSGSKRFITPVFLGPYNLR